jgi:hypothetical protein
MAEKSAGRIERQRTIRSERDVSATELLGLCIGSLSRWIKGAMLRAHIRSLERLADYFAWQQQNGAAGLADTQKRIVMAKSDLRRLQ